MTDFFDDLERQLIDAATHRPGRLRRAQARRGAVLATVLLAVLAGGAGLATALSGRGAGDDPGTPAAPPAASQTVTVSPQTGAITPAPRRPFTVAILNATAVPGLARGVANRLQNARFKIGNVTNAADQSHGTTAVHFSPGRVAEARQVARALQLRNVVLRPITPAERAVAADHAAVAGDHAAVPADHPAVVVIVGADQNTAPQP